MQWLKLSAILVAGNVFSAEIAVSLQYAGKLRLAQGNVKSAGALFEIATGR